MASSLAYFSQPLVRVLQSNQFPPSSLPSFLLECTTHVSFPLFFPVLLDAAEHQTAFNILRFPQFLAIFLRKFA